MQDQCERVTSPSMSCQEMSVSLTQASAKTKTLTFVQRIPLKVGNFDDPPVTASDLQPTLANIKNEDSYMEGSASDGQLMYPFIVFGIKFYAESQTIRMEWKSKLDGAVKLRNRLKESDSFIGIETLSSTGFTESPAQSTSATASSNQENPFTGTVTCSVPFSEWNVIYFFTALTHQQLRVTIALLLPLDAQKVCGSELAMTLLVSTPSHISLFETEMPCDLAMRRVLHLKHITQCAVLDDYGILLVLAHGSLLAYTIKSLVSSTISNAYVPDKVQKLNGNRPVEFFRVGCLGVTGHTFVIYMKKKGVCYIFVPVCNFELICVGTTGSMQLSGFGTHDK